MTAANILDENPEEMDRDELLEFIGGIEYYRYKLADLETRAMEALDSQ